MTRPGYTSGRAHSGGTPARRARTQEDATLPALPPPPVASLLAASEPLGQRGYIPDVLLGIGEHAVLLDRREALVVARGRLGLITARGAQQRVEHDYSGSHVVERRRGRQRYATAI